MEIAQDEPSVVLSESFQLAALISGGRARPPLLVLDHDGVPRIPIRPEVYLLIVPSPKGFRRSRTDVMLNTPFEL